MFNRLNADHFTDRAREVISDSKDLARSGADQAFDFIHSRPVVATILGVGVGLFLSIFFRRRKLSARRGGKIRPLRSFPTAHARKRRAARA